MIIFIVNIESKSASENQYHMITRIGCSMKEKLDWAPALGDMGGERCFSEFGMQRCNGKISWLNEYAVFYMRLRLVLLPS